ncbi:acylphosphatase [Rhodanobacter caeni]|uniref:acylphosphatase n=1 Tax=Rhodanobacter caeni TaxID=657654 RepID=A0ABN0U5Q3_9GAMM
MPTARFIVTGKVQGVFYRASTREQARMLGICGQAENRADGSVEVLASGSVRALEALERWLSKGPPMAVVDGVSREDLPERALQGFWIG